MVEFLSEFFDGKLNNKSIFVNAKLSLVIILVQMWGFEHVLELIYIEPFS